jgi:hypothetical protein
VVRWNQQPSLLLFRYVHLHPSTALKKHQTSCSYIARPFIPFPLCRQIRPRQIVFHLCIRSLPSIPLQMDSQLAIHPRKRIPLKSIRQQSPFLPCTSSSIPLARRYVDGCIDYITGYIRNIQMAPFPRRRIII